MALSIQGATCVSSASTSIAIPTHAANDLIVIGVGRHGSAVVPTKPAAAGTVPAWVDIDAGLTGNGMGLRTAQFKATASTTTSGTWTNAQSLWVIVFRGQNLTTPIGGHAITGGAASATHTAPAVTMSQTNGTSGLVHIFYGQAASDTWGYTLSTPAGYTMQASSGNASFLPFNATLTKDVTTSDGSVAMSLSAGSPNWQAASLEVLAAAGAANTGAFFSMF